MAKSRGSPSIVPSTKRIRPSRTSSSRTANGLCILPQPVYLSLIYNAHDMSGANASPTGRSHQVMKNIRKLAALVLLPFSLAASLLALPQVPLARPDEAPNFYFTRLVYTQNPYGGRRGNRGTMAPPDIPFRCPEF